MVSLSTTPSISHRELLSAAKVMLVVAVVLAIATPAVTVLAKISETSVIELVNAARAEAGLPPLKANAKLEAAALAKANDMFENDYFSHTSPSGKTPWNWVKEAGYTYKAAGENLAINYTDAEDQHQAWMKSETHRANILNTRYQEIGVVSQSGVLSGKQATVTVQMFGAPLSAVAQSKATNSAARPAIENVPQVNGIALVPAEGALLPAAATPSWSLSPLSTDTLVWLQVTMIVIVALMLTLSPLLFLFQSIRSFIHGLHAHRHHVLPT